MNLTKNTFTVGAMILSLVSAFTAFGRPPQSTDVRVLASGQTLEREMTGAESHLYKFDLKADEFFQVRVEQKGVDVTIKLMDSSGQVLATMDSPNGKAGAETLSFIAPKSGSFLLEVSGLDAKAEKGSYSVRREASRTATMMDKHRVEVERLFVEGLAARNIEGQREIAIKRLREALAGWEELGDNYLKELTAQQLSQLAQVPPEINAIIEGIKNEFQDAQKLLSKGQELMTRSNADSLPAREKLNHALTSLHILTAKVTDKNLQNKISQSGESARQSLNYLKTVEFYSRITEALTLNGIAQTHANLGERQESIDYTKQANTVYQEIISDKTFLTIYGIDVKKTIPNWKFHYAAGLGKIGTDLDQYFGRSAEGIGYLTQAIETYHLLYQETQNPQYKLQEAHSLTLMGTIYSRESKTNDKAIEALTKSLELFRTLPNQAQQVAGTLSVIGARQSSNYDFKNALENWKEALAIYREIDDKFGQSNVLWLIGTMYWVLNDRSKVLEFTDQNLAILQSPDFATNLKKSLHPNVSGVFEELYVAFGEHARLDSIAIAYRLREDFQKSLKYYEDALAIAPSLKDLRPVRSDLTFIAHSYAKLESWDKAAEFYKQALDISRARGVTEDIADDLADVGWTLMEAGKPEEALRFQNEALSIYQTVGVDETKAFSPSFSNLLNEISRSHYALGNRRFAIFYGKRAVNAVQGERQRIQSLDAGSQRGFLEKKEQHYRRLADWLMDEGRIDEAKQVLAMLKEEEIHSFLREDASESDSQQRTDLNSEERNALNRYNALAQNITVLGSQFGKLQMLKSRGVKLTEEQDESYRDLSSQLSAASSGFQVFLKQLAEEFAQRSITKGDLNERFALQSKLKAWGEGVVFLYTLVGDNRYRVILVTPDTQVDGKHEITASELNYKIEKFRDAVQNPRLDPRPLGKELYDILIKPIEKQLDGAGAKTLLWSLDGNLRLLPLAALWDGKEYFDQKYQNVTITLASRNNLGDPATPNWRALGLATSQAKTVEVKELGTTRRIPFAALPGAGAEVRSIIKSKQSSNGVMPGLSLIDLEFNKTSLESALLRGYKIVHIASHLNLDPSDATKSFLLLGDGTVLTVTELRNNPNLRFRGIELLTLSACKTAVVGKDSSGKEIEGFGYVAQQKGANAILATLWSVADESTQLLMSEFYRLHQANPRLTKAGALQLAQQEMIEGKLLPKLPSTGTKGPAGTKEGASERTTDERIEVAGLAPSFPYDPKRPYAHPYYWAPFTLIGNWK